MGFELEPFGPATLLLKGAPAVFGAEGGAKLLADMIDAWAKTAFAAAARPRFEELAEAARLSRLGARRPRAREPPKSRSLLAELDRTEFKTNCPHGRPVHIQFAPRTNRTNVPPITDDQAAIVSSAAIIETTSPRWRSPPRRRARFASASSSGRPASGKIGARDDGRGALGAEIVNADSRQFYRGMDIGTAKPSPRIAAACRIICMDVCAIPTSRSTWRSSRSWRARRSRRSRRAGETCWWSAAAGFYLRVLRGGIFAGPAASPEVRRELEAHRRRARSRVSARAPGRSRRRRRPSASAIAIFIASCARSKYFDLTGEPISAASAEPSLCRARVRHADGRARDGAQTAVRGNQPRASTRWSRAASSRRCARCWTPDAAPEKPPLRTDRLSANRRRSARRDDARRGGRARQARHAPVGQAPAHLVSRRSGDRMG